MLRKLACFAVLGVVALGTPLTAGPAQAGVIVDADAASGSAADTFGRIGSGNCEDGSITAVTDATQGRVWRFHKPRGTDRCEARGIRVSGGMFEFANNATYYLGWRSRLTSAVDNKAVFQWKSYGDHSQNFPVVLKMIDGKLTMLQRQPEAEHRPWSRPVAANSWHHVALGIHTSDALTGGWVEVYLNGAPQTFSNGSTRWPCRTWDSSNDAKWGINGASDTTVTNFVDGLKVGTRYADVRMAVPRARKAPPAAARDTPAPATTAPGAPGAATGPAPIRRAGPVAGLAPDAEEPAVAVAGERRDSAMLVAVVGGAGLVGLVGCVAVTVLLRRRRLEVGAHATGQAPRRTAVAGD